MKPNWKDYLLGTVVILGIAAFIPSIIGVLFAANWVLNTFPIASAIVLGGSYRNVSTMGTG